MTAAGGGARPVAAQRRGNPRRVDDVSLVREFGRMRIIYFFLQDPNIQLYNTKYIPCLFTIVQYLLTYLNGLYTMHGF
jgi:hypothetical protein